MVFAIGCRSLCTLWSWWGEDPGPLDGTLGQRSWGRCRGTGGNIKLISHEAGYFLGEIKCQSRSGFHLEVDLDSERGKIKIKILVSQEGVQNVNTVGMPKRVKGDLSEGAVEGQKQGGVRGPWVWVWVGEGLLDAPPCSLQGAGTDLVGNMVMASADWS